MSKYSNVFYSKDGIKHILKHKKVYKLSMLKIKTLVKLHILERPETKLCTRKNHINEFLRYYGSHYPREISRDDLLEWLICYRNKKHFTNRNMCHIKCQLNYFFKWLIESKIIDYNPIRDINFKQNEPPKRRRVILNLEEIESVCLALENSPIVWKTYFNTLIHTGARMSEVLNLKWSDLDIYAKKITFYNTKNSENRTIHITSKLAELLTLLLKQSTCSIFIFADKEGKCKSRHQVQRYLRNFKNMYPIENKDWKCHDLRHSFAFNFLRNNGEMYQLKSILGHKSIRMTIDLYGNLNSSDLEKVSPYNF